MRIRISRRLGLPVDRLKGDDVQKIALNHAIGDLIITGRTSYKDARSGQGGEFRMSNVERLPVCQMDTKRLEWLAAKRVLEFL